ncbi:hypothetical protein BO70DRAFT_214020 [Aspergillus heteromorphus CBS 117.55]|uniref:Glyoxalase-like domain-containing protein n=1 Tax=Aspergillus heteromorphus CBS 117.55 TaxID=1448321 RepID=A0A317WKD9_9EURO|nr:uncharacterized protein BO70DRAFT_214020 [Aspergillus heteromorphus CBS 117.55]PWY86934.1 hypothetical protein BO70DRAFT_214020 [Aspergillus heteromorphus CBS 117.55]
MSSQQVFLDHLLLQFSTVQFETPSAWLTDRFTIVEGGTHAGGLSRNKLIIFADGTYLELLNWIKRPDNWRDRPGDFALTTLKPITAEDNRDRIVRALDSISDEGSLGITYSQPIEGGRKTLQGDNVRWKILKAIYTDTMSAAPERYHPRGRTDAPFFCHDVTDRIFRVPYNLPSVVNHPSGATGISGIEVLVPKNKLQSYITLYTGIVGSSPQLSETNGESRAEFELRAPGSLDSRGIIRIRAAKSEEDERYLQVKGVGISSLIIRSESAGDFLFPVSDYLL